MLDWHRDLRDVHVSSTLLLEMGDLPAHTTAEQCVQACRDAMWNWSLALMGGQNAGAAREGLKTPEEALATWGVALEYWEAKCQQQSER